MKRYTVAEVRQRLSEALDEADAGRVVIVERHGVRYRLVRAGERSSTASRLKLIEILDPAIASGQWTWEETADGLTFRPTRRRTRA